MLLVRLHLGYLDRHKINYSSRAHNSKCRAGPVEATLLAGIEKLPYFHPHSLRKTLGRLGGRIATTPEALKAWSQNLGHEKVLTTLT